MLCAFTYYFLGNIRIILYALLCILPFVSIIYTNYDAHTVKLKKNSVLFFGAIFLYGFIVQIINDNLSPFLVYFLTTPAFAFFLYKSKFNTKILYIPFCIISLVFIYLFTIKHTYEGVFYDLSANYVSVVMLVNVGLINIIEYRQRHKIAIFPSFLGFLFSLLAMGRSGILCCFTLFLCTLWWNYRKWSKRKKVFYGFLITLVLVGGGVTNYNKIVFAFENAELLEKFNKKGLKSPSRDILLAEYIEHIDLKSFFTGYNFKNNSWFIYYGLNPHNSYIRLHSQMGIMFFVILISIAVLLLVDWRRNKYAAILLIILLLRAWTDTFLFLGFYDFMIVYLLLILVDSRIKQTNREVVEIYTK